MLIKRIIESIGELIEGPIWCRKRNSLLFVDILLGYVHEYIPKTEIIHTWKVGDYVGCVMPVSDENEIIIAVDHSLKRLCIKEQEVEELGHVPMPEGIRFNDGKCGPGGQLWLGTMSIDQSREDLIKKGGLYRVMPNGYAECVKQGLVIPNGMAWDLTKNVFYHVETDKQAVFSYQYDQERHMIGSVNKIVDLSQEPGVPDGMSIDSQGKLWIAMWGGKRVICVDPLTGRKIEEVEIPDSCVSCCTFGGENMDRLYVTTAWDGETGGNVYELDIGTQGTFPYEFHWKGDIKE